jgi:hypothetical protein
MSTDVFLSVGRTYTAAQENFVSSLERLLRTAGVNPRTVGRNDFSSNAPLRRISDVLDECHGTVVLAFERALAKTYLDRPGSTEEVTVGDVRLPTVWNQIEAAMSYAKGKPLLVVVERGMRDEGLLEARYDWYVQWIDLTDAALRTDEFRAVLDDWIRKVKAHENDPTAVARSEHDASALTIKEILGALTVGQLWGIAAAVASVFVVVATVAYKLGTAAGG